MTPRQDVSEERKNQILDAATNVFSRFGFHKARMDDIVDESGLSKGALYWYFKSKDDIIIAILERIFLREFKDLDYITHSGGSSIERLWIIANRAIEDVEQMKTLMPIAYEFIALAFRHKYVRKAINMYYRSYLDMIIPIIEQGVKTGELRDVDPNEVAIAFGSIIEGTALLWIYDSANINIQQNSQASLTFLFDGIKR